MRRHRREDVASVERRGRDRQPQVAIRELTRILDPAERLGRREQQPIVRPDEDVATPGPHADRPPLGADSGVDNAHVDADREVGEGEAEQECPVADRVLADGVGDIDDLRVAADGQHDRAAGGGGTIEAEVGEEAHDRARRARLHGGHPSLFGGGTLSGDLTADVHQRADSGVVRPPYRSLARVKRPAACRSCGVLTDRVAV